jgi:hypothetical protein
LAIDDHHRHRADTYAPGPARYVSFSTIYSESRH